MRAIVLACWLILAGQIEAQNSAHGPAEAELAATLKRFQLAPGLKLELFAAEPQLQNPVAFTIDGRGRFYIAETHRYGISVFDITQNTAWLSNDLSFRSVAERHRFLTNTFATNLALLTRDSELVRLVEDRDGDGRADYSEVLAEGFNEVTSGTAAGILVQSTNLWFGNVPGLWRIPLGGLLAPGATNPPGVAAPTSHKQDVGSREQLATGFGVHIGVTGHDLHGLTMGPDGRVYMSFGDRGVCITNREGRVLNYPDTGGVLRCEPDGAKLEMFCFGLRNPQELAFDDEGNLWTSDNDTAGPDPCRVLHLVEGGDYGWRCSYQHMEGFGPWVKEKLWQGGLDGILPPAGTVSQGPSGLSYFPGTGFGERFKGKFLHCDFPGGVWAFSVKPRGASFEVASKEKILWNAWPTDVDFGPDGALYVSDWVGGWAMPQKGRLYRIYDPDHIKDAEVTETRRLLAEGMAARPDAELLRLLGQRDRRVRLEAQWALAARGTNSLPGLIAVATGSRDHFARLHALWAFGQILRGTHPLLVTKKDGTANYPPLTSNADLALKSPKIASHKIVDQLGALQDLLDDDDPGVRAQTALILGDANLNNAGRALNELLADENPATRLLATYGSSWRGRHGTMVEKTGLVRGLARERDLEKWLGGRPIVHITSRYVEAMLRQNAGQDEFLTHAGVMWWLNRSSAYSGGGFLWIKEAAANESRHVRRAALLAMRRLEHPAITNFLHDADAGLRIEAARAIHDLTLASGLPAVAGLLDTGDVPESLASRVINANLRLGSAKEARRLVTYATRDNVPVTVRVAALDALAEWAAPSPVDRVTGLWRPMTTGRLPEAGRAALTGQAPSLLGHREEQLVVATARAAAKLALTESGPALFGLLGDESRRPETRAAGLRALAVLKHERLAAAVALALADTNGVVRREGIQLLAQTSAPVPVSLLEKLLGDAKEVRQGQAALGALGESRDTGADDILARLLDRWLGGQFPPEWRLELLEAAAKRTAPAVTERRERLANSFVEKGESSTNLVTLAGGDATAGRKIFMERPGAECLRCHIIKGQGGTVGPDLSLIGAQRSRVELLESILYPNRQISPGYENVTVRTKSGRVLAGVVASETATVLELASPEDGLVKLERADLASRNRTLSAMPEGLGQFLSQRDLRDLIEFLAGLK